MTLYRCPKCIKGTVELRNELGERFWECINCGWTREFLPAPPPKPKRGNRTVEPFRRESGPT